MNGDPRQELETVVAELEAIDAVIIAITADAADAKEQARAAGKTLAGTLLTLLEESREKVQRQADLEKIVPTMEKFVTYQREEFIQMACRERAQELLPRAKALAAQVQQMANSSGEAYLLRQEAARTLSRAGVPLSVLDAAREEARVQVSDIVRSIVGVSGDQAISASAEGEV